MDSCVAKNEQKEAAKIAFDIVDDDHDGMIDSCQLRKLLIKIGQDISEETLQDSLDKLEEVTFDQFFFLLCRNQMLRQMSASSADSGTYI